MKTSIRKKSLVILFLLVAAFIYYVFKMPNNLSGIDKTNYLFLLACFIPFGIIITIVLVNDIYMFEPMFLAIVLYVAIFLLQPLQDIINGKMVFGEGCIKATILVIIGLFMFLFGYYHNYFASSKITNNKAYTETIPQSKHSEAYLIALIIWVSSVILCFIYFLGSGYSISYVLSMGSKGEASIVESSNLMIFFTFKSCMTASWMYIFLFGKSRVVKSITFFVGAAILATLGGRTSLFQYLMTPVFYYYIKRKSKPKGMMLIIFGAFVVIGSIILQHSRYGVRNGTGFVMPEISMDLLLSPFGNELSIYHSFYAVVNAIPKNASYLYGAGMIFYTLVMMIPRGIWPGKPNPPIYTVIGASMGQLYVDGGAVYPNIGEYYVEFGIVGVVVLMYLFGVFLKWINKLRLYSLEDSHGLILYASVAPLVLPLVSRGYTPSNFYQFLLTALPVFVVADVTKRR